MECHIQIDSHHHYASPTILAFFKDGGKSNIKITNITSTGINKRNESIEAHIDIEFRDKTRNSKVFIGDCAIGDSTNIVGVSVNNVAEVYILNTIFYNIHVTDVSRLGTNKRAAAGVTTFFHHSFFHFSQRMAGLNQVPYWWRKVSIFVNSLRKFFVKRQNKKSHFLP